MDDTPVDQKILAVLKAEKERRLQAKVDSGKVVRLELVVTVGTIDEADAAVVAAKIKKERALRESGETRPIHFDVKVIVTGVPRRKQHSAPLVSVEPAAGRVASKRSRRPSSSVRSVTEPPPPESRYVWVQLRECEDSLDPGAIKEARFHVDRGEVVLTDMAGGFLASQPLFPNQDPASLARSLLRSVESGDNSFNRKFNISRSYGGMH
jgi:hypothetical protein